MTEGMCLAWCFGVVLAAAEAPVRSDQPNAVTFPAEEAKLVRFVIRASSSNSPCVDELEVYGPDGDGNLALAEGGAKATASSCLAGYAIHQVAHLNDGRYGNEYSWIAAGTDEEWAQIELPARVKVSKVVFSRDRNRHYADRVPIHFAVQLSLDGAQWKEVKEVQTTAAAVAVRRGLGDFPGVVPSPPPPPKVTGSGKIVPADAPADPSPKVPEKDELGFANLALNPQAEPAASSLLPGHAIHQVAHLNDGLAGNEHSWISREEPSWAEIDLGDVYWIYQVAFASDDSRRHNDRAAATFSIRTATEYDDQTEAPTWKVVHEQSGGSPVHTRRQFRFEPVRARWVRIAVDASSKEQVRIDEIEIFGQKDPIPADKIGPIPEPRPAESVAAMQELVRYAFLGEEHAWLKTYGRADVDRRLVETAYREKRYPKHVGDDHLPLPPLAQEPRLDGRLDDACWAEASRGVVRVAYPYDFEHGPLVTCSVTAGHRDGDLWLAIRTDRLLSGHLAVVSTSDGQGSGVVAYTNEGLVFNTYVPDGRAVKLKQSSPVEGALDESLTCCELRLPLDWLPDCREQGIRVGLGMGAKHTLPEGRPVSFAFSPLSLAQIGPCTNRAFRVRLAVPSGAEKIKLRGNAPGLTEGLVLAPGQSKVIVIPADAGQIGPEYRLSVDDDRGESYVLNLFRYDPLERTLTLMEEMVDRFAEKGLDVRQERDQLTKLRRRQKELLGADEPDRAAEREAFFQARLAKRQLLLGDPELAPIEDVLFVERQAFEPSHNYSVILDSRYRPGGSVCTIHIPRRDGRLRPEQAAVRRLFDAGGGIARNPMANFDLTKIYFGYRPSEDGYYHVMSMNPDGSDLKQLTFGPFHDYWPCPLPDGGLAFISTRCRSRYLCWRPQAAVLFRMDADGQNVRPLSFANLTEWGPSVMSDGRVIWQRSEYVDKGADYSHTLWSIRPDGRKPELVFGNTLVLPQGYANGREVPGTNEICCTLISHFGDLNGPIALVDVDRGRFSPEAIRSITPEVPWPGAWPREECFRDPVPVARDYVLLSHAPRDRFGLFLIDRFGNRELLYMHDTFGSMCPTPYRKVAPPPVLPGLDRETPRRDQAHQIGQFFLADVYRGLDSAVPRGTIKYLRVAEEVRSDLIRLPDGSYQNDHQPFMNWYAAPVDKVRGPFGWPSYVAKATWGLVPVEEDGSASFSAPAGKQLYFQVLDAEFNEVQRMRSVVQVQAGERRSCIGCHDDRRHAPGVRPAIALKREAGPLQPPPWGPGPFSYRDVVQPVLDAKCVRCHHAQDEQGIDLTGTLDADRIPASYRTLISQGWVHHFDFGWKSGENLKAEPLTFGTVKSKLWDVLQADHYDTKLTEAEMRAVKCWTDLNCPLWPDYMDRTLRPGPQVAVRVVE